MTASATYLQSVVTPITASVGVLVTASATPHAKGAWVDLFTAAANLYGGDLLSLTVSDTFTSGSDTPVAVDLAVGAAGSEVVVLEGLLAGHAQLSTVAATGGRNHVFPFFVPRGVRVAVRCQALAVSDTVNVTAHLVAGSPWGDPGRIKGKWETYGFDVGTSRGLIPTAGSANVKGAWLQAVATTTRAHRYFFMSAEGADAAMLAANHFVDIGAGDAASEIVVVPDINLMVGNTETVNGPFPAYLPLLRPVPSGSRIAVRTQSNQASNADLSVVVHAF